MHQSSAALLDAPQTKPDRFHLELQTVARRILFDARRLSDADRQFVYDLSRQEARFPFRGCQRLIAVSRQCLTPEVRESFPELIRAEILAGTAPMSLYEALGLETGATGPADVAAFQFLRHPSPATKVAAIEALERQLVATRHALAALHASP